MAPATHQLVLAAGERIAGLWQITDDEDPPAPETPVMATCVVWRTRDGGAPVDWSPYLFQPGADEDPPAPVPGELALAVPGEAVGELEPGGWTAQIWGAFEADTVPDRLLVSIAMRVGLGLQAVADRADVVVEGLVL